MLVDCRAVYHNDEENMPEFRVDFPAFSGNYCLTSTNRRFGWRSAMAKKVGILTIAGLKLVYI